MKQRTMEALAHAEDYFVAVIEQEAGNNVVPSRTEELCQALCGLEDIAIIKYKEMCKQHMKDGRIEPSKLLSR